MSYNKTNWQTGDVVTAQKLNNIEEGIETADGKIVVVNISYDIDEGQRIISGDKTYAQMQTLCNNGAILIGKTTYKMSQNNCDYSLFSFYKSQSNFTTKLPMTSETIAVDSSGWSLLQN